MRRLGWSLTATMSDFTTTAAPRKTILRFCWTHWSLEGTEGICEASDSVGLTARPCDITKVAIAEVVPPAVTAMPVSSRRAINVATGYSAGYGL